MRRTILTLTTLLFFSCNSFEKENAVLEKENELLRKELEFQKKEISDTAKENKIFNPELNVDENLIHCQNRKFIIRIDRMKKGILRYASWNKPAKKDSEPGLILLNGEVERQGTMGGYFYTFKNSEWTYIIEDVQMGENDESVGIFLKLLKKDNEILYAKMEQIK